MAEIEVYVSAAPVRVEVGGAQGTPAVALMMKPPVANLAALPVLGNTTNDGRVTEDTGNAYRWTGSAWTLVGPFRGDAGAAAEIVSATAVTGEPGTEVAVALGGTSTARTFQFTIPKGDAGTGGSETIISDTRPSSPVNGMQWMDSTSNILSVWIASENAWIVPTTNAVEAVPNGAIAFNGDILTFGGDTLTFAA